MKRFIFITILLISLYDVSAQIKIESVGAPSPIKLPHKEVFDSAKITVFYDYGSKDSFLFNVPVKTYGEVLLLIGDRYMGTMDRASFLIDSVTADYYWNKTGNFDDLMNLIVNDERYRPSYNYPVVVDLDKQEAILRLSIFSLCYKYKQQLPRIEWKLENEEKKIKGVRCLKATCRFGGRDWTAWYAPEYAMPYGPYLFNGLPGLIMQVVDKKKNFAFKFKGIEKNSSGRYIYMNKIENEIETTREKAREGIKNYCKDPTKVLRELGRLPENKTSIVEVYTQGHGVPYNPIELE